MKESWDEETDGIEGLPSGPTPKRKNWLASPLVIGALSCLLLVAVIFATKGTSPSDSTTRPPANKTSKKEEVSKLDKISEKIVPKCTGVTSSSLRFAVPVAQSVMTYVKAGKFKAKQKRKLNILDPYEVINETSLPDGKGNQVTWYELQDRAGNKMGWVPEKLLYVWNNRHALEPSIAAYKDKAVYGYCSENAVYDALNGRQAPCVYFKSGALRHQGNRSPFLVVDGVKAKDKKGHPKDFLKVLVPTIYSNLVPAKNGKKIAAAGDYDIIVLIDGSSSMKKEIRQTAKTISNALSDFSQDPNVNLRAMVVVYRDHAKRSKCKMSESILDSATGKPKWVSIHEAVDFLNNIDTCRTEDDREALWDVLYSLRTVPMREGARRVLMVAGDAPGHQATRGGEIFGESIPAGINADTVFASLHETFGASTTFIGILAEDGIRESLDQLRNSVQWFGQSPLYNINFPNIRSSITQDLRKSTSQTQDEIDAANNCLKKVNMDTSSNKVPLFCGTSRDDNFAARVADLALKEDDIVIREIWVNKQNPVDDVVLLSKNEASKLAASFRNIGEKMELDGTLCRTLGEKAWVKVIKSVTGAKVKKTKKTECLNEEPNISDYLRKYWQIHASDKSLLSMQPKDVLLLSKDACEELGKNLTQAHQNISERIAAVPSNENYLWLPFSDLP